MAMYSKDYFEVQESDLIDVSIRPFLLCIYHDGLFLFYIHSYESSGLITKESYQLSVISVVVDYF
jgi:hypothetical protein